jgi:hypothetical protein
MQRFFLTLGRVATLAAVALTPLLAPAPAAATPSAGAYRAASPEYGMSVFVYGNQKTTRRDLGKLQALGFGWQKSLFRWRDIETDRKGQYQWEEADRVVKASAEAGLKIIARIDFQPHWARRDGAHNGAPDRYEDFADFLRVFVDRYKTGSPNGTVQAVEVWNETNLQREWGNPVNQQAAADYVRMLGMAYRAAKESDPNVTIITAGLSPTGWNDDTARPDDDYLNWMFDAGLKGGVNYDVLGAHGNTQCPSVEADFGNCPVLADRMGHASFYFRRIEQLRAIMEARGDGGQQVWLLEFGWTTDTVNPAYSWYATTEDRKAQLFMDAFRYASQRWSPWIGVMTVWTLSDPSWSPQDEQVYWAITNPDGSTRPAYDRLLKAAKNGELPALGAAPAAAPAPAPASAPAPIVPAPSTSPSSEVRLRVFGTDGEGLHLRAEPTRTALSLKKLSENAVVTAIGDPRQSDGLTWYNVRDADGTEGWAAAQYLTAN